MYIIAFENEADYKRYSEMVNNDLTHGATLTTSDPWEAVARHEAKSAVENKLVNVPELYYKQGFKDNVIVDGIVENLIESDLKMKFYQEASDEFDNQVKDLLGDTYGI